MVNRATDQARQRRSLGCQRVIEIDTQREHGHSRSEPRGEGGAQGVGGHAQPIQCHTRGKKPLPRKAAEHDSGYASHSQKVCAWHLVTSHPSNSSAPALLKQLLLALSCCGRFARDLSVGAWCGYLATRGTAVAVLVCLAPLLVLKACFVFVP